MTVLKSIANRIYGLQVASTLVLCAIVVGALILVVPGLTRRRRIARIGLRLSYLLAGMPFQVEGVEAPEQPCVAVANHRSYLDGLAVMAALPPHFAPVIKEEVSHIPLVGLVLRRVGALFVERTPPQHAAAATLRMHAALRAGDSLCLFPEGTFSADGGLLPFRLGAFLLACETGSPLLPVAIRGADRALPMGRVLPRAADLRVRLLDPIEPDGDNRDAARRLRDRAEDALWTGLNGDSTHAPKPGPVPDYDYYRRILGGQSLPLAYLDLDLLERNTRAVLDRCGGKQVRLATKDLRCPAVIDRILRSDPRLSRLLCYAPDEACFLAREYDLDDLLVAYPTPDRRRIDRVCELVRDGWLITLTADSSPHLRLLEAAAQDAGCVLPVCLEVDMSLRLPGLNFGVWRSPIRSAEQLVDLARAIQDSPALKFQGLRAYDAQLANLPDHAPEQRGRQWLNQGLKAQTRQVVRQRRRRMLRSLEDIGLEPAFVNGGGTGSLEFNAFDPSVTEISAGAGFFAPVSFDHYRQFRHLPAAGYAIEVVRRPAAGIYTCLGGGYTASGAEGHQTLPRPYLPAGACLDQLEGAGEVQTPIRYRGELELGDPVFMRHAKAGELCEQFNELVLIEDGRIADRVPTYRGLGHDFL